jgi:HD-like signal output (HDOD) protein
MTRILFVDDDPLLLQGLRRLLRTTRTDWSPAYANSGAEALEILARERFDVIVTDMRMPGMDGNELLTEVMRRHPHMIRVVLSGQAEQATILRSIGSTHQYLWKPCDAETLYQTLARARALRTMLASERLKRLVSHLVTLPSPPELYLAVLEECRSPRGSIARIAEIVSQDLAMTAKILHIVNSAFFGQRRRVVSALQAVQLLGLNTVKALVLSTHVFAQFRGTAAHRRFIERLQAHSLRASACARLVAVAERCGAEVIEDACVGALLHDTGELVLVANLPDEHARVRTWAREHGTTVREAEVELLGASHGALGAYLLGLWALPDSVVESVAYHDAPTLSAPQQFGPLTIAHVADVLGAHPEDETPCVDVDYLERLGLAGRLGAWRDACAKLLTPAEVVTVPD